MVGRVIAGIRNLYRVVDTRYHALKRVVVAGVSIASFAVVAWYLIGGTQQLRATRWTLRYQPILYALPVYIVAVVLAVTVWGQMLRCYGSRSSWLQNYRVYAMSNIARRLPTPAWFLMERIAQGTKVGISKSASSVAALMESALILFSGLAAAVVLWPITTREKPGVVLILLSLILTGLIISGAAQRLTKRLAILIDGGSRRQLELESLRLVDILRWSAYYLVVWLLGGVVFHLLLCAIYMPDRRSVMEMVTVWVVGGVISNVAFVLPGGFGIKELTLAALLSRYVPGPIAIALPILVRLWYLVADVALYLTGVGLSLLLKGNPDE